MAVRSDFSAGEVLAAVDLNDTFGSKLNVSAYEEPGLELITTETFSAVSSISLNGCFSSTYANYQVIVNATANDNLTWRIRLRAAGSDATGTDYTWGSYSWNQTTLAHDGGSASTDLIQTSFLFSGFPFTQIIDVGSPALATKTQIASRVTSESSTPAIYNYMAGGAHRQTVAYDGFTLFVSTSNITGNVRVYGYKNS